MGATNHFEKTELWITERKENVNSKLYSKIIWYYSKPFIDEHLNGDRVLLHDRATCYTSKNTKEKLEKNGINSKLNPAAYLKFTPSF